MKKNEIGEKKFAFFNWDKKLLIIKSKNIYVIIRKVVIFLLFLLLFCKYYFSKKKNVKIRDLNPYKYYINDCKKHKRYIKKKIFNNFPYISICLPVLNMENYIEQTILSIINQSFQDFQIIIINDNSQDNTENNINGS